MLKNGFGGIVRRVFFYLFWTTRVLFGVDTPEGPPTPQPPLPVPAPTRQKRVPFYSFWNSASICILINTWNYSAAELWDKNWDTDAHAHVTYQAPIIGLHSFTLLLFLQDSTDYLMLAQSCKFGVIAVSLALTQPAACTECVCLWLLEMSTDPPFYPIYSKRVPIDWAWAEDSDGIFEILLETPTKKLGSPLGDPPHPFLRGSDPYIYQSKAFDEGIPSI